MRTFPKLAALTAGLAVFAGTLGGGIVLAQADDTPTPTPPANTTPSPTAPTKPKFDAKGYSDDFLQQLATNLGIDVGKLKDAIKQTSEGELQKLVDNGVLTQDQADKIKSAIENGNGNFPFNLPFFGGKPGGKAANGGAAPNGSNGPSARPGVFALPFFGMENEDAIAGFLGIDKATYESELKGGKTPAQVAQDHGKSRDDFKAFLQQQYEAQLQQAVTAKKLSQDQADKLKANEGTAIDHYLDSQLPVRKFGPGPKAPKPGATPTPGG